MFRIQNKATKDKPKQQRLRQRQVYNEQNDSLCCATQSMKDRDGDKSTTSRASRGPKQTKTTRVRRRQVNEQSDWKC